MSLAVGNRLIRRTNRSSGKLFRPATQRRPRLRGGPPLGERANRAAFQVADDVSPGSVPHGGGNTPDVDGAEHAEHPDGDGGGVGGGDVLAPVAPRAENSSSVSRPASRCSRSTTTVRFSCRTPGSSSWIDLVAARVNAATLNEIGRAHV